MFPLHLLLLPLLALLPLFSLFSMLYHCFPYSACFSYTPWIPHSLTSPLSYYTIPTLLSSPVMRVLQQPAASQSPTHHQGVNHLLCQLASTRLASTRGQSVSQAVTLDNCVCVCVWQPAHANVANGVADCIIAVGNSSRQLATPATAQHSVHSKLPKYLFPFISICQLSEARNQMQIKSTPSGGSGRGHGVNY